MGVILLMQLCMRVSFVGDACWIIYGWSFPMQITFKGKKWEKETWEVGKGRERVCKYMQLCQNMCKILTILNWKGETCMIQYEP